MTDTPASNRKAADQLHDLRQRINALRDREQELRRGLIAGDLPLEGDDYAVIIETKLTERVDLDAMRERVAESVWRPFVIEKSTTYVNVRKRAM
jgi:hypothetical protein